MITHEATRYYILLVAVIWTLFPQGYRSVAVEASYTEKGPSSVTQCVLLNKAVEIRQSWNPEKSRKNELVNITGVSQESAEYVNNIITCKWKRNLVTSVYDTTFNILTNKYYLVLAKGPTDNQGNLKYHGKQRGFSSDRVNLSSISLVLSDNSVDVLISMHGEICDCHI
ncbi:uncharacterized protein LOC111083239 [Limulus polyphemus]|uniref:Uncharacterized protein LOC111083239 n=1 Tax=Limulus polyphemus TaxID=6850 RepID=A0ABM1RVB7_LIMPO|nr:uncharacterized protein LOC111083239 [Limulus polyphemus]